MTLILTPSEKLERRRKQMRDGQRRFRIKNPGYRNKYGDSYKRYVDNNREKVYARSAVYRAVKKGILMRPDLCENCGVATMLEADHENYDEKLKVTWLCKPCHVLATEARKSHML